MLNARGAKLYYEVRGAGPTLLLICGGPTDADHFADLADLLAERYTVVTFDPRGNSRSEVDDPEQDVSVTINADDAHALIAAIGPEPAYVYGLSGGALTGLDLLTRFPTQVMRLVADEPPLVGLLSDAEAQRALGEDVYDTFRSQGLGPAMMKFMVGAGFAQPAQQQAAQPPQHMVFGARMQRNAEFFLGHYFRPIANYAPDFGTLRGYAARIVVAVGETSGGQVAHRAGLALAERLGIEATMFPGGHGGASTDTHAFAERLDGVLRRP
jgi:pimeloyl-ACP methyl ester carboxylesterase